MKDDILLVYLEEIAALKCHGVESVYTTTRPDGRIMFAFRKADVGDLLERYHAGNLPIDNARAFTQYVNSLRMLCRNKAVRV